MLYGRVLTEYECEATRAYWSNPTIWFQGQGPEYANIPNLLATIDSLRAELKSREL